MWNNSKEKVFTFSLNERMILNTIITGLGIRLLIGVAVYFTEKMNEAGSPIGFMWFTEKRIARPIENLAEVAGNYYLEHSD